MPLGLDDGAITVALNKYRIHVGEFFAIAYNCAEKYADSDGKIISNLHTIIKNGPKTVCFYRVPVIEGVVTWHEYVYAYITDICLNTGGMHDLLPDTPSDDNHGDLKQTGSWCHYGEGSRVTQAEHCYYPAGVGRVWDSGPAPVL